MFSKRDLLFDIPQNDDSSLQISGNGEKGFVVICRNSDFNKDEQVLLKNIMQAVKHDFEKDIFVITVSTNAKILLNEAKISYNKAVIFGMKPNDIGINIEYVQNQLLKLDNYQFIFSQPLKEISTNQGFKTALWKNLQAMFA